MDAESFWNFATARGPAPILAGLFGVVALAVLAVLVARAYKEIT